MAISGHPKLKHQRTTVDQNSSTTKVQNQQMGRGSINPNADLPGEDPAF